MQANADWAVTKILISEGGYVNHPEDDGGPTNKGITLATFRRYIKPKATISDLKALTTAQAKDVYRQRFWNSIRADELPSGIDYAVFDFGVNSGPVRAIRYMQASLQHFGLYNGGIDGKIGPKTLNGIRSVDPSAFITFYCSARLEYLKGLSDWKAFGNGWENRITRVKADALSLVKTSTPVATKQSLWTWFSNLLQRLFKR